MDYLASNAWSALVVAALLGFHEVAAVLSPLALVAALPYFTAQASDVGQAGHRRSDVARVCALNLLLIPVNAAGCTSGRGPRTGATSRPSRAAGRASSPTVEPMDSTTGAPPPVRLRVLDTVFRLEPRFWDTYHLLRRDWSRCVVEDGDQDGDVPFDLPNEFAQLPEGFTYQLTSQLTRRGIEALAGQCLMFHAAGVSDPQGRTLALIGASGAGKTTAARALASAGWGYVTDEAVAVVDGGGIIPYPKPLSLVTDSLNPYSKRQVGPDQLDLGRADDHPILAGFVLLDRVRGESRIESEITEVGLLDALLELTQQTSALARLDAPLQRLCHVVQSMGVHRLTYSDVEDAAALLAGVPALTPPTLEEWEPIEYALGAPVATWAPARFRDAVRIGDEGLILVDRTPVRLSALGLTILLRCRGGATPSEVLEAAEDAHGPHPEAARLVHDALASMAAGGVLLLN